MRHKIDHSLDATWNPVTVHPTTGEVILHPGRIDQPCRWRKPSRILVARSDLFDEQVPDGFIAWVWITMAYAQQHTFLLLTKRPERMQAWVDRWNDLTGETDEFKGVRGPEATLEAHPSGRGQLFAAYLEELGKACGVDGVPPPGAAWPTFDWMDGPRWWPTYTPGHIRMGTFAQYEELKKIGGAL